MSLLPWPASFGTALAEPGTNRSLFFDRGFADFEEEGSRTRISPEPKRGFLRSFATTFQGDLGAVTARRRQALARLQATEIPVVSQTPLVVGLGLPSVLETGLLLDRLTGSPYLPGSSVKGLARATARLVMREELPGDVAFWREHFEAWFGPDLAGEATARKGRLVFYDAFPGSWPRLLPDVLTPHYGGYYGDPSTPPGDWDNPVPVPFLSLAPGTAFSFFVGAQGDPLSEVEISRLRVLLLTGLDWLGIGGKRSQGYGAFGEAAPAVAPALEVATSLPPTTPLRPGEARWEKAELSLRGSELVARYQGREARGRIDQLDGKTHRALSQRKRKVAEVTVEKAGSGWKIRRVERVEDG